MNRNIINTANGETMLDLFGLTRQSYIGKEKEPENDLADHGVRKYDYETGRFNSIDPLFEKYYGWSPYQYSMNNPITRYDDNGKWVKEISNENDRHSGKIQRNANGNLAKRINYEFYENWKSKAPAVAEFVEKTDLFVMQKLLGDKTYGESEIGGNLSFYDLTPTKKNAHKLLEGNVLHEIVHNMGGDEFQSFSAMFAAGYITENRIIYLMKNNKDYFYSGLPYELEKKYFGIGKGNFYREEFKKEFIEDFKKYGEGILKGSINPNGR